MQDKLQGHFHGEQISKLGGLKYAMLYGHISELKFVQRLFFLRQKTGSKCKINTSDFLECLLLVGFRGP